MPRGRRAGQDIPSGASDLRIPCFPRLEGGADWHDTSRVMPGRYHADIIGGITTLEGLGLMALSIINVGGCHHHRHDQPRRVHQQMALAPFDLFVAVKPHFLALRRRLDTLAIGRACGRLGEPPLAPALDLASLRHHPRPHAFPAPAPERSVHRLPRPKSVGHMRH